MHHSMAERSSNQYSMRARKTTDYQALLKRVEKDISYKVFFKNPRAMTAVFSSMIAMIFMLFYEPILTPYLNKHYLVDQKVVGNILKCWTYVRLLTWNRTSCGCSKCSYSRNIMSICSKANSEFNSILDGRNLYDSFWSILSSRIAWVNIIWLIL